MNLPLPTGPIAQAVGWALIHLLWQGTLVAVVLACVLALLPARAARTRYVLACVALLAIVVLGVATAVRSYHAPAPVTAHAGSGLITRQAGRWDAVVALPPAPDAARALATRAATALPAIVATWLAGVALCSARLLLDWRRARRLVASATASAQADAIVMAETLARALGIRHAVRVLESAAVHVPSVIGVLRPAILLPASTLTGLTAAQLEMILAHELAHVRRHDFLVNLLQAGVETLAFYHPGVWWISQQVRIERENCCDDLAISVCGDPVRYARALTRLEELRGTPALAMRANGGSLVDRVRRIVGRPVGTPGPAARGVAALTVLACVTLAIAAPTLPAIGHVDDHGRLATRTVHAVPAVPTVNATPSVHAVPSARALPAMFAVAAAGDAADSTVDADDSTSDARDDADWSDTKDGKLSLDALIELRSQDVTAETVQSLRALFPGLALREIASMKAVGATPEFVREMRAAGLTVKTSRDAESLAALGVTGADVKAWRGAGLDVRTAGDAAGLAAVGVTPKFLSDLRAAGLTIADAHDAQGLAAVGVTPELLRGLRDAGIPVTTSHEAQSLAAVGVTPEYIRGMRAAGVRLEGAEDVQSLKALDVTPEFVRKLADAGYRGLRAEQLTRLAAAGVTDDFVREMSRYKSH